MKGGFSRPRIYSAWSWVNSWFGRQFTYFPTSSMTEALRQAYQSQTLLGIKSIPGMACSSLPRVAVTTTVDDESRLLTNYRTGDGQRYLGPTLETYKALVSVLRIASSVTVRMEFALSFAGCELKYD